MILLEICVETPEGVAVAAAAGADRIELCSALDLGGLTPGSGLIAAAAANGIAAHAMIRPRAGGFVASEADLAAMEADIGAMRAAGLAGVVIGVGLADGRLDLQALARLVDRAGPLAVTLHRVFDLVPDPIAALEDAVELGIGRILTSGQAPTAPEGVEAIARLATAARGRIEIMAGGGVTPAAVPGLLAAGVDAIHASCAAASDEGAQRIGIPPGRMTDGGRIAALRSAMTVQEVA